MSASLTLHVKHHRDVPYAYSPDDFFTFRATSASRPGSNLQINLQINFSGTYHTRIVPGTFLHSAWPLYLSLPRNQCMTMINERIACPEISKGFIERTLRVQSRWCFTLRATSASNLQINFSGSLHTYLMPQSAVTGAIWFIRWWKVESCMSEPGNNGSMWHFFLCVKDKNAKAD